MISIVEFLVKKHLDNTKLNLHVKIESFEQLFDLVSNYLMGDLIVKPKLHVYNPDKDGLGKILKVTYKDGIYVHNWFELIFNETNKFIVGDNGESIYFQYKFKKLAKWDGYPPTMYKSKLVLGMYFDEWLKNLPNVFTHGEKEIKKRFNITND